jgi:hypothetical protein
MNVRLDYRHIHYWQRTLGRADRTPSADKSIGVHASETRREVRPEAPNPLQQGAPTVREKSLRYPWR